MTPTLLELCSELPVRTLEAGEVLIEEGTRTGRFYVLEAGRVEVLKGELRVALFSHPGAVVGEMSTLLDQAHTATVRCLAPSRFRVAENPDAFLVNHPGACLAVARMLAQRLGSLTRYLVDLKAQFEDQKDHLGMVDEVLESLLYHQRKPPAPPA
jgi:CRP-like cAMP-binding protein